MNHVKWIFAESEGWVRDGIITTAQQAQILGRYEEESAKSGNPLLILFSVISALLIGTGIILIFATNWWRMYLPIKLAVAFLPLLLAQAACVFTALKRNRSTAFREGSATFIAVAFFATVALIGQSFHIASDLREFLMLCGVFALPPAYLFRSKAALSIYVVSTLFASQGWLPYWVQMFLLTAAALPLFYLEIRAGSHKGVPGYLMLLLSALTCSVVIPAIYAIDDNGAMNAALSAGLAMLIADAAFQKISPVYFFSPAKLLGRLCIAATICAAGVDFAFSGDYNLTLPAVALLFGVYAGLRRTALRSPETSDLFALSAVLLAVSAPFAGVAANVLLLALGVGFVVYGSKQIRISYINIGMAFLVLLISLRFFDSSLSLLIRGVVFILMGIAILAVNIVISRKWRGNRL